MDRVWLAVCHNRQFALTFYSSGDALACIDSRVFLDHGPVLTVGAGLMLREVRDGDAQRLGAKIPTFIYLQVTALGFRHQPKRQLVLVIVRNTIECVYARTTASSLPPSVPQYRRQESNASTRVDTVENRNILTISEAPVVDLTSSQHQAPLYVQDNHGENGAETGDKENCCRIRNMIDQDQLLEFADSENTTKNYLLEAKVPQTPYTAFKAKEHSTTSDDAAIALARADSSECEFDPNQLLIGLENLSDEWL